MAQWRVYPQLPAYRAHLDEKYWHTTGVIQEIYLHRDLEQLQKYLEVSNEQVLGAAASLAMLSPVGRSGVEIAID